MQVERKIKIAKKLKKHPQLQLQDVLIVFAKDWVKIELVCRPGNSRGDGFIPRAYIFRFVQLKYRGCWMNSFT